MIESDNDRRKDEPVDVEIRNKQDNEECDTADTGKNGSAEQKIGINSSHFSSNSNPSSKISKQASTTLES